MLESTPRSTVNGPPVALDIHQTTQPPFSRADARECTTRRRYLVLAMAAGLFAIVVGVWQWAPDTGDHSPGQGPATTIVSSRGKP